MHCERRLTEEIMCKEDYIRYRGDVSSSEASEAFDEKIAELSESEVDHEGRPGILVVVKRKRDTIVGKGHKTAEITVFETDADVDHFVILFCAMLLSMSVSINICLIICFLILAEVMLCSVSELLCDSCFK